MKKALCASLLTLLAVVASASADPGGCVCPIPPITLYTQPPPLPSKEVPLMPMPAPLIFRKEAPPPKWCEAPPPPPIQIYQLPPREIKLLPFTPPQVSYCQGEVMPPKWCEAPPLAPVTFFQKTPEEVRYGPLLSFPPITIVNQPQPAGPCYLGCVGGQR